MQVYIYAPNSPEYRRQQLIVRADLHIGSHINKFIRWTMPFRPEVALPACMCLCALCGSCVFELCIAIHIV